MEHVFDDKFDPFSNVSIETKMSTLKISKRNAKKMNTKEINLMYFKKSKLYEFLKTLNPIQMNIVLHKNGSVICSAVPGAGKTKTLVYKVAYLIEHCNVDPNRILVITFTKKAANEIRDRIEQILLKTQDNRIISGTFHSVCHRFLKALGLINKTTHIDSNKQTSIIQNIVSELTNEDLHDNKFAKSLVMTSLNEIANAKNKLLKPVDLKNQKGNTHIEIISQIYEKYENFLNQHNYIDFDDLLVRLVNEIKTNSSSKEYLENRFDYVFVDEFQDTNMLQFDIIKCFAVKNKNITIVGDTDQSIYGWRFADSSNITKFKETFPDYTLYLLNHNYRSTRHIINCANSVIKQDLNRINSDIITTNDNGNLVELNEFTDQLSEATYICNKILHLSNKTKNNYTNLSEIAILLRTNQQTQIFENILTKLKIPFKLLGNYDFYDSEEIQLVLSYLKFIVNKTDIFSFKYLIDIYGDPRDNACQMLESIGWDNFINNPYDERIDINISTIVEATKMYNDKQNISMIIQYIIKSINLYDRLVDEFDSNTIKERWDNVGELLNISERYETIETFLIDMVTTENGKKMEGDKISLLTTHSSKGLEWNIVFVPSIVESFIPHFRSIDPANLNSASELSEERRLLYVAMTRAKLRLFLSYTKTIKVFGKKETVQISRFLNHLPKDSISFAKK